MLRNADQDTLTVHQIAAHLNTRVGNVTRELNLGAAGQVGRLRGERVRGPGLRGRGGQWRVDRTAYLDWLGVPAEDRSHLDVYGLPRLMSIENVAAFAEVGLTEVAALLERIPHLTFGRRRYLTHHQLERLSVLLTEDCRDSPR